MSGVARSALTRCRQIAEQVLHLSGEATSQVRMFESSERRGRELAKTRLAAKRRRDEVGPTISKRAALTAAEGEGDREEEEEEDLWDDEL